MKSIFENEKFPLILLTVAFFALLALYWGHLGSPLIDCGREAYLPWAITKGEVLYKDLLCIYAPLSYLINAFAYKSLGANLNSLWIFGAIFAYGILLAFYFIAREFLNKPLSTLLGLYLIVNCVFSFGIFNYVFPYAYAILRIKAFFGFRFQ